MKKALCLLVTIIGLTVFAFAVQAQETQKKERDKEKEYNDLSREKKLFRNYSGEGSNSVISFCMEDQVFIMVSGNISNYPSIVQVYEEKNGNVVPKKCK